MANNAVRALPDVRRASTLVATYVAITVATFVVLAVLTATAPALATSEAWGHAVIVGVFAVLLPLRLRAAREGGRGGRRALTAVVVIASVLVLVNVAEAFLPAFPGWMRGEMVVVAALMVGVGVLAGRARARGTLGA